ncbi:ribosome-associated protein [Rhizobiales bacterium GAS191]|nr:ribosome-associated protein [Rhizobiales bacterium GAS113]SED10979.1 ribosome-associated protein [Rhizobiales bacterium GAS191]
MIAITPTLSIDESEISESFVRASGPGGQHVNTTSSAVQLRFDARRSPSLPNDVAIRLMKLAGSKLTQDGVIVIQAQAHRSLKRNRDEALARLVEMIREASIPPKSRRPTRPPRAAKERRLTSKVRRGALKSTRRSASFDE